MKGGQGGKDIWMIKKVKRDEWSEPINLGNQINTSGDERFLLSIQMELCILHPLVTLVWVGWIFLKLNLILKER